MDKLKVLEVNGLKYSRSEFDGYKIRCTVKIKTVESEHLLDIYTTDTSQESVENILLDRKSANVFSLRIINWKTKEEDDAITKFIDEL